MPTRKPNAKAIFCCLDLPLALFFIMKNKAVAKLVMMPKNARATMYFMDRIIT